MKASKFSDAQKAFILKLNKNGVPVADICRKAGISQATLFHWKKKYDRPPPTEMRRLKQLEDEERQVSTGIEVSLDVGFQFSLVGGGVCCGQALSGSWFSFPGGRPRRFCLGGGLTSDVARAFTGTSAAC